MTPVRKPIKKRNRNSRPSSSGKLAWLIPATALGIALQVIPPRDAPIAGRSPASEVAGEQSKAASKPSEAELDPVLRRLQSEALALIESYASTGGPRSFKGKSPQGSERYEARANYILRELGKKLHAIDPDRFPTQGLSILNVGILIETVPGHGRALAELIKTHRGDQRRDARLEIWKKAKAGLPFQLDSESRPPEKKPRNLYVASDSSVEDLKAKAFAMIEEFADQGGPWPKDMKADPDRYQAASRALSNLRRMNLRLSELDPSRFVSDQTLENIARLFENDSEEGQALAALLRHNRAIHKAETPRLTRQWHKFRKQRLALDCLTEKQPK